MKLQELIDSKIFVRNEVNFPSAKSLVMPFVDELETLDMDYSVTVQNPVINKNEEGTENAAYPRFGIVGYPKEVNEVFPEYRSNFGLLVAMDTSKPLIKVYTGFEAKACLNLTIFRGEDITSQDLLQGTENIWKALKGYREEEENKIEVYNKTLAKISNINLTSEQLQRFLGMALLSAPKYGYGTSTVVNAARLIANQKSSYYGDKGLTGERVYNVMTEGVSSSNEIITKPNKTLGITKFFREAVNIILN